MTTLNLLRASRQHVFRGTMRYPGQKSNSLEMKQISLAGLPLISTFINLEIKRAHVIKCHKSRNQISGRWKDIETGLAESDKQIMSSWVLWALNHSSPDATLLHLDHTHLSMSFMFSSSQLFQMLHELSYVHVSDNVGKMYIMVMLTVVHNHIAMVVLTLLDVGAFPAPSPVS